MCGIFGIATAGGRPVTLDQPTLLRMRDRLEHRGPDGAGLLVEGPVALAHRRLAILDPEHGAQPLTVTGPDPTSRTVVSYNGEIYNHAELRRELSAAGHRFETNCDTETLAAALSTWWLDALPCLRGMFAVAAWQPERRRLLLARDEFGMKPLCFALIETPDGPELVFASEPRAILDHPHASRTPDWTAVSAYLTTIRTTLDRRTMFHGVWTVMPGEALEIDLSRDEIAITTHRIPAAGASAPDDEQLRATIDASVEAHMLSDRPLCSLLSGGLDSTIIAATARRSRRDLGTWAAGAPETDDGTDDLAFSDLAASALGTQHRRVVLDRGGFAERWPWMIERLGCPLGTPNEVAIHALAESIAPTARVALSGEGADEMFAGYGAALAPIAEWIAQDRPTPVESLYLDLVGWIGIGYKPEVLQPAILDMADGDAHLVSTIGATFEACGDDSDLSTHLRVQQALNLPGLLGRLDTSMMLASVEGRTPFADREVAAAARAIPIAENFACDAAGGVATATMTKERLRRAYADVIPPAITARPKASFPLPFQSWVADQANDLLMTGPITEVIQAPTRELIALDPSTHWRLAWPIMNVAMWLRTFW